MRSFFVRSTTLLALIALLCGSAAATPPTPTNIRTWVSGVGDDVNPGSRTAPTLTLAGSIAVTVAGGEIDSLDPANLLPATISEAITVDGLGSGSVAVVAMSAAGNALTVSAGASDTVILRNLTLVGDDLGQIGISFTSGKVLIIQNCIISGFTQSGVSATASTASNVVIMNSTISGGTNCVSVNMTGTGANVSINNSVLGQATNGVSVAAGTVDLSNSTVTQNSGAGLLVSGGTLNNYTNNQLTGNGTNSQTSGSGVINNVNTGISLTPQAVAREVASRDDKRDDRAVVPPVPTTPPGGGGLPYVLVSGLLVALAVMGPRGRVARGTLAFLVLFTMAASSACAQLPTPTPAPAWVSGVGDDANPCSRTAPCFSIDGALPKATIGGYVTALDPGDFSQYTTPFSSETAGAAQTVGTSMTFDAAGTRACLAAAGSGQGGLTINPGAGGTVYIRGLSLQGLNIGGTAINITSGANVVIEDCDISGWTTAISASQNAACTLQIVNTSIAAGSTGVALNLSNQGSIVSMSNVHISNTANAVQVSSGTAYINNSLVSQNSQAAFVASGGTINSSNNVLADNGQNVSVSGSGAVNTPTIGVVTNTTSNIISVGQTATFKFTIIPQTGTFSAPVTFSCVGLPAGLTCTFTPPSVPAGAGATQVTMTISPTTSSSSAVPFYLPTPPPTMLLMLALVAAWLTVTRGTKRMPSLRTAVVPLGVFVALAALAGCGGSSSSNNITAISTGTGVRASASPSPSPSASTSPNASPSPSPSPNTSPVSGKFVFTLITSSGSNSVSQTFSLNVQ